jgi:hypothetical protein
MKWILLLTRDLWGLREKRERVMRFEDARLKCSKLAGFAELSVCSALGLGEQFGARVRVRDGPELVVEFALFAGR